MTERASNGYGMAPSRGQGHYEKRLKQMTRRFSFRHLENTLGVCRSGSKSWTSAPRQQGKQFGFHIGPGFLRVVGDSRAQ